MRCSHISWADVHKDRHQTPSFPMPHMFACLSAVNRWVQHCNHNPPEHRGSLSLWKSIFFAFLSPASLPFFASPFLVSHSGASLAQLWLKVSLMGQKLPLFQSDLREFWNSPYIRRAGFSPHVNENESIICLVQKWTKQQHTVICLTSTFSSGNLKVINDSVQPSQWNQRLCLSLNKEKSRSLSYLHKTYAPITSLRLKGQDVKYTQR